MLPLCSAHTVSPTLASEALKSCTVYNLTNSIDFINLKAGLRCSRSQGSKSVKLMTCLKVKAYHVPNCLQPLTKFIKCVKHVMLDSFYYSSDVYAELETLVLLSVLILTCITIDVDIRSSTL